MASFAQESTRYVNYQKKGNIEVIEPMFWEKGTPCYIAWAATCHTAEQMYFTLLNSGATPQQARSVLPTSLKTEVVISANLREWRYIFKLRCDKAAHPQMRELMIPLLADLQNRIPIVFDDISA
jgi:thymidylate synthase (FAD)